MCASAAALGIGDSEYASALLFLSGGLTLIVLGVWGQPSWNRGVLVTYGVLLAAGVLYILVTYKET